MKRSVNRIISLWLVTVLVLSMLPFGVSAAGAINGNFTQSQTYNDQFTDMSSANWYYNDVKLAYEYGLMNGLSDTTFGASGNLTVAQTLAIACRLHSIYNGNGGQFSSSTPWYMTYVEYALSNGIISSGTYSDYTANATRGQVAAIFAKALPSSEFAVINDVSSISDVQSGAPGYNEILMLYRAGILTGFTDGTFKPGDAVQRSQIAAIATRMILPEKRVNLSEQATQPTQQPSGGGDYFSFLLGTASTGTAENGTHTYVVSDTSEDTDNGNGTATRNLALVSRDSDSSAVQLRMRNKEADGTQESITITLTQSGTVNIARIYKPKFAQENIDVRATIYPATFTGEGQLDLTQYSGGSDANAASESVMLAQRVAYVLRLFEETYLIPNGYTLHDLGFTKISSVDVTITLDSTSRNIRVGETFTLMQTITPTSFKDQAVTWSSSNPLVAEVSSTGVVTGKSVGKATITAAVADASATCEVTVTDPVDANDNSTAYAYLSNLARSQGKASSDGSYYYYAYSSYEGADYSYIFVVYSYEDQISLDIFAEDDNNNESQIWVYIKKDLKTPYRGGLFYYPNKNDTSVVYRLSTDVPSNFNGSNASVVTFSGDESVKDKVISMYNQGLSYALNQAEEELLEPNNFSLADLGFTSSIPATTLGFATPTTTATPSQTQTPTTPRPTATPAATPSATQAPRTSPTPRPQNTPGTSTTSSDAYSYLFKCAEDNGTLQTNGKAKYYNYYSNTSDSNYEYNYYVYAYSEDKRISLDLLEFTPNDRAYQAWIFIPESLSTPYTGGMNYYPDVSDSSSYTTVLFSIPKDFDGDDTTATVTGTNGDDSNLDHLETMYNLMLKLILSTARSKLLSEGGYKLSDLGFTVYGKSALTDFTDIDFENCVGPVADQNTYVTFAEKQVTVDPAVIKEQMLLNK